MPEPSPFRTWNGRAAFEFVDGVCLHAIGGDQVLLCRVSYDAGKEVPWHTHEEAEQVMLVLEGEVELTIEEETRTLAPGDVVVVSAASPSPVLRRRHYGGACPVPLDHVPDLDLVLGPDGAGHVERYPDQRSDTREETPWRSCSSRG
jgi:hypothetical protein